MTETGSGPISISNRASKSCHSFARSTVDGWNRFWFVPSDPATLALIRIAAGLMLFYTHFVWSFRLEEFFGRHAWLSVEYVRYFHGNPFGWSYLSGISSPTTLWAVHLAALMVFVMLTFGFLTRVNSILAFLITVAYAHRVPGALFGLDQINAMLVMYLMVGPSGAAFSLDSLFNRWRTGGDPRKIQPSVSANIAIRLIQLHMCVIYLFAGCGKLFGETWWAGTALWGAFANYEYQTLDMTWLAAWPLLVNALTQLTLAWEISYCALIWPRLTRPLVLLLAVPLHLGIALCLGMITFGLVMLIGNLAFVSPLTIRRIANSIVGTGGAGEQAGGHSRVSPRRTKRPR